MRDSKKLDLADLWLYGFPLPPEYDYENHTWKIKRFTDKHGIIDQKIFDAKGVRTYAPTTYRKIINFCYKGKNVSIPLAKFIYVMSSKDHVVPENYYARINEDLEDPYLFENIWIESKEEVEKHKNKGNQYHSEKWHILPKN